MTGAPPGWTVPSPAFERFFRGAPSALLVIRAADMIMVDANDCYLATVGQQLDNLVGRPVFDVFPDSPDNPDSQVATMRRLMTQTARDGVATRIENLRFDIPSENGFEVRWWNVANLPVFDESGIQVEFFLNHADDVTEQVRTRSELAAMRKAQLAATRLVTVQAELALALVDAHTPADVDRIILDVGLKAVGADGGGVVHRSPDGSWLAATGRLSSRLHEQYGVLPHDSSLPIAAAARSGQRVLLPTAQSCRDWSEEMAQISEVTRRAAWAALPLVVRGRRLGAMAVSWREDHHCTPEEVELLDGLAAQCALALDRIEQAQAQRRGVEQLRELAESLQAAMLSPLPVVQDLEIAVRYRSADDVAQVGGDWYDGFVQPDGATMVVIGDVCGHDHVAAGKMAQMRVLLRALAFDAADQPHGMTTAATLVRYEQVSMALGIDELATVVLARIEADGDGHLVRWCNAGSPPPVLVETDGEVRLLDDKPDVMLGVDEAPERSEHVVHLAPGATLLLYTDGLIERRETSIDDGISDLAAVMGSLADTPLEQLCDQVLDQLSPHIGEDDVALLAIRLRS